MAHSPISRLNASASGGPSDPPIPLADNDADDLESLSLADLATALSSYGGGDLSADLALDLVLNEIVEQAKLATNATAAAIALARDGEMFCRATTGANAPDLGVRLDSHSGLSGSCVQNRRWQRCDDTELDTRVDANVCRRLGVRSILVFPVLKGTDLLGVMEIFSPVPHAFTDREIQTLDALSRSVIGNIDRAASVQAFPASDPDSTSVALAEEPSLPGGAAAIAPPETRDDKDRDGKDKEQPRDYWTSLLMILVVALAVTLGWVVGRVGEQQLAKGTSEPNVIHPAASSSTLSSSVTRIQTLVPNPAGVPSANQNRSIAPADQSAPSAVPAPKTGTSPTRTSDLVVYEKGKVIFRLGPQTSEEAANHAPAEVPAQGTASPEVGENQLTQVSSQLASEYLDQRVEPEYPEPARAQHIQGSVVLQVVVGKDGAVEKLQTISGDPLLAQAASDAVQQWHFRPFFRNGQPQDFQTRITVSFRLP